METYNVIEILTGNIVFGDSTQEECVEWINTYGDIINHTIKVN